MPRHFPVRRWRRVLFTCESRFTLLRADDRRRGAPSDACVIQTEGFSYGVIMDTPWDDNTIGIIHENLTTVCYREQVLQPMLFQ